MLASGGMAVSSRTAEDEEGVGLASSRGCTVNVHCMQTCLGPVSGDPLLLAWSRLTAKEKGLVVASCTVDAQISPHPSSSLLSQAFQANPPKPKGEDHHDRH